MTKRTGPTNYQLQQFLVEVKPKTLESNFWKRISEDLQKPTRQRRTANLYTLDKYAQDGETIVVPGKVLSVGNVSKKLTVAAFQFSTQAKHKIEQAKGRTLTLNELLKENPQAKNVRILG